MTPSVYLLFLCEACTRTSSVMMLTSLALVGQLLSPRPSLATLPLALAPVATMLTAVPAARLMQRRGRRPGFALGACLGAVGGLAAALAVIYGHFPLLCLGAACIGAGSGFATYYRFAAAEVAEEAFRSQAISLVMAGGVVAAFVGASVATWARDWLPESLFAGTFLCVGAVHLLALATLLAMRLPRPERAEQRGGGRSLLEIARQSDFLLAVGGALLAWGVMSLLMNVTPLSMKRHMHSFADTAQVIQWHVLGMYVPSFFTGHLITRFGEVSIMRGGLVLLLGAALANLGGTGLAFYFVGLTLLGVGWNFLFVGSTSLLTRTHAPEEKARVQACNDFLVFAVMVLATFSAAPVEEHLGWLALNRLVVPLLLVGLLGATVLQVVRRRGIKGAVEKG